MKESYLNKIQFQSEVQKCLHCKSKPCEKACPLHCSPHDFIEDAQKGLFQKAADELRQKNPLAHCCGVLCPDMFCQKACLRARIDKAIDIPAVQAFIMKQAKTSDFAVSSLNGKKVAVIGAGPAGLGSAWQLAKLGYKVSIFEKEAQIGGAMDMIPLSRFPQKVLKSDWEYISQKGRIKLIVHQQISDFNALFDSGFDGVVFAGGRSKAIDLGVIGEEFTVSYMDYLSHPQDYVTTGKVAIVGGGNVAVDCALTAKQQGAKEVTLFIRRKIFNMKVTKKEFDSLLKNEIDLTTTTRVCKVEKENKGLIVSTCSTMETEDGYQDIKDSIIKRRGFSLVIKAIGNLAEKKNLEHPRLVCAGDYVNGASTVVEAVSSGIEAAKILHKKIKGEEK